MARRILSFVLLVLLVHRRPERLRQIQHNRRVIVRVWISRVENEAGEALGAHTQLSEVLRSGRV